MFSIHGRLLHYPVLVVMALALFFMNLGGASLWDVDEGRNATASLEMLERGKYIVPTFNSQLRVDKPALLYWLQMGAYRLFGVNEFAARLPSALAALLTVLLAYELGRAMFGAATAFLGAALCATTPMLCGAARFANPDALLNTFTVLTLALFWIGQAWPRTLWFMAMGASAGLAILAKGPVGIVLPGTVIFLFLLWERRLGVLWDRRLGWGVLALFLVAAPWYVWVAVETKADFLRGFILKHNVQRFLSPMENHAGFPGFYLLVLLVGTLPWSAFFGLTCWYSFWNLWRTPPARWQRPWQAAAESVGPASGSGATEAVANASGPGGPVSAYRFLVVWALLYLVFFTAAATKLPNYVLPVVPPLSLLTGRFLERWRRGEIEPAGIWLHISLTGLLLTGAGLSLGILLASGSLPTGPLRGRSFPDLAPWAFMGLLPVTVAVAGWFMLRRRMRAEWLGLLVLGAVAFWAPLAAFANEAFDAYKAARASVEKANAGDRREEMLIGGFQVEHLASLHFYTQRNILHHLSEEDARAFLRYPMKVFLFLPAATWETWPDRPANWRVVSRCPDLYRSSDVVVITNRD